MNSIKFLTVLAIFIWIVTGQLYTQKYIGDVCDREAYSSIQSNINLSSNNSGLNRQEIIEFPCYDKVRGESGSDVNVFYQGKGVSFLLQKILTRENMTPPEHIINNYSYKNINSSELIYLLNNSFLI